MMNQGKSKYLFWLLSVLLLFFMLYAGRIAGINCDEVLHYNHSLAVYDYFASDGKDQSALNTPETFLKYYGQSYDNLATILAKWFNVEDIYQFRHLMSSVSGWLAVMMTAFFAVWLEGYGAGILVILLFAVSPTFLGHSQNNLKDIPFALAYISGIYFSLRFLSSRKMIPVWESLLLMLSIAFCISIRAGGLLLICYLFLFYFSWSLFKYVKKKDRSLSEPAVRFVMLVLISVTAYFLSMLLWPYALQDPLRNVLESYRKMAHFPATFRQIFEGKVEWSDYMPWYYLIKSMIITIPLIVTSGLLFNVLLFRHKSDPEKLLKYILTAFTLIFPLIFVLLIRSNLYSSWRQFLFLYPGIVLFSATGYTLLLRSVKNNYLKTAVAVIIIVLSVHPVRFMSSNLRYSYIYYNQLVGGLAGAYSNYETDYYYVSQTEASEWLINYLKEKGKTENVKIKATYSVNWMFRNYPGIETSYFRNEERSMHDWDYAIVTNRYISPYQLKNKIWPPKNTIYTVNADGVPLCAVLERRTKSDYYGYEALRSGKIKEATGYFEDALSKIDDDEMIFYNFGAALYQDGQHWKADSVLKKGLEINPDFDLILMYLGNIAKSEGRNDEAVYYYERLLNVNRKYFDAYVELAGVLKGSDVVRARQVLRTCLEINPGYKQAIIALAETYTDTNPEIAEKYIELLKTIDNKNQKR
ncbi:MAG: hypothetical protein HPY62_00010 [Bacteroidales bacterium]|nr:hypothetical protein [Bacteroidales bacterium]